MDSYPVWKFRKECELEDAKCALVNECWYSVSVVTLSPDRLGVKCSSEPEHEHPITKVIWECHNWLVGTCTYGVGINVAVLAETSLKSPRKLFISIIQKYIFWNQSIPPKKKKNQITGGHSDMINTDNQRSTNRWTRYITFENDIFPICRQLLLTSTTLVILHCIFPEDKRLCWAVSSRLVVLGQLWSIRISSFCISHFHLKPRVSLSVYLVYGTHDNTHFVVELCSDFLSKIK